MLYLNDFKNELFWINLVGLMTPRNYIIMNIIIYNKLWFENNQLICSSIVVYIYFIFLQTYTH